MSEPRKLRSYEYVNRSYERVHAVIVEQGGNVFQRATNRADALISTLRVKVGVVEVGVDVQIAVERVYEEVQPPGNTPVTRVKLRWRATRTPGMFPSMVATLSAYPLDADETQLEMDCEYEPPLGLVGNTLDAWLGHRVAEAAVKHFLDDVVAQLRRELPVSAVRRASASSRHG